MSLLTRASTSRQFAPHLARPFLLATRNYSELRRPQTQHLQPEPVVETFSATSRPRPYYAKHPPTRELPRIKKRWPSIAAALAFGIAGWAAFMTYVTNQEKISSSVVRQIMRSVREDEQLKEVLGDVIRPQPEWWLNGDPMIHGKISQLQGNVDVSFRIKGSKGIAMLTSRLWDSLFHQHSQRERVRFKVICDDGTTVLVDAKPV
ncbi:hypothetical protein H0H92_005731 [Tricholoma furcatifolium]|nr:hypothetical protein H0H92_005731 [Tricholoma furcatifolium]